MEPGVADSVDELVARGLAKAGVAGAQRHLFFCLGPDCCAAAGGEALWEFAKRRIRELALPVMRTKAACFRVCAGGPILVVYPEGVWYAGVTPERLERILCEHIRDGVPVREWIVAVNALTPTAAASLESRAGAVGAAVVAPAKAELRA